MDRAMEALQVCGEKLASHNIRRFRLIATEACRQATNGQTFLDRVKTRTGLELEIIDRQTEAFLAAEGCGALMDRKADAAVLFDIGGGSSELVLVNQRIRKKRISDQIVSWTSVPIGVVTLAERHGGQMVTAQLFRTMIEEVKAHLADFPGRNNLDRLWENGRVHLLGTSGTVTTLAGVHLNLPRYDRRQVDGLWMSSGQIDTVIADLLAMDYRQRAKSPCVGAERADLVMAGCAILEAIRETWPSERLRVADRGLREGILTQMMERDAAWLAPKRGRWRNPGGRRSPGNNPHANRDKSRDGSA
jgi:exopolyphosphatase/guanosine-5'-triphosphate,3'-diphosphate pyrophosphatase